MDPSILRTDKPAAILRQANSLPAAVTIMRYWKCHKWSVISFVTSNYQPVSAVSIPHKVANSHETWVRPWVRPLGGGATMVVEKDLNLAIGMPCNKSGRLDARSGHLGARSRHLDARSGDLDARSGHLDAP